MNELNGNFSMESHQAVRTARREAGFSMAALVIFLTAASILLTISVPSYVMEAKREQEKELIFRGEEYTRAIQKYQRTLNLLPTNVDDLLSSNGTRFLRKAYADPVSGEPWRVIILNADGTLTGSNIYPTLANVPTTTSVRNTATPATAPKAASSNGTLATSNPFTGAGANFGGAGGVGGAGVGGIGGAGGGGVGAAGGVGGTGTGITGGTAGNNGQRPAGSGAAAPTGAQPIQPQQQATPLTGIVGVGSASKGTGVMVYNTQEQYSNWEFIATLQQRATAGGAGGGAAGGGGAGRPGGTGGAGGVGGFGGAGGAGAGGAGGTGGAGGAVPGGGAGAGGAGRTR
jgi:competence protein ComGC